MFCCCSMLLCVVDDNNKKQEGQEIRSVQNKVGIAYKNNLIDRPLKEENI